MTADDFVVIGTIGAPYGVRGWFRVNAHTENQASIQDYSQWFIKRQDDWQPVMVNAVRPHGNTMVASFEGVTDRNQAMALTHTDIAVQRTALPALHEDEYYWHDLIGMDVLTKDKTMLGQIQEVFKTGANDVMVVEGEKEHLIPFIMDQYVLDVDMATRVVVVDWDLEY